MKVLQNTEILKFSFTRSFDFNLLAPISSYVNWKLINGQWDDYNELFHATKLVEIMKNDQEIWFDTHNVIEDDDIVGVLLIVGGKINKIERNYEIKDEESALFLKYFHVVEKGKGIGSHWLKNVIFPHYERKGYTHVYVNSSHKASFSFYRNFGKVISTYEQLSDNGLFKRVGQSFKIKLNSPYK